ncbi:MAG: Gfo/Idh/MocA family oxidoreductase [Chloroflexota bacterium]
MGEPAHPLRWGIIGAGNVAEFKGGPALQQAAGSTVLAVMRRDAEQAAAVAARLGVPRVYSTLEGILADPEIDAVYIATPVVHHCSQTIAAAEAGKHVLVEKPMGMNRAECAQMIAACRAHGVRLGVAYYRRFYPVIRHAQALLASGALGDIIAARAQYVTAHVPRGAPTPDWRLQPAISGGGCLADVGVHRLDLLLALLGPADAVSAFTDAPAPGEAERIASVHMHMRSGAHAACTVVWGSEGFCDELEIIGRAGRLVITSLDRGQLSIFRAQGVEAQQFPAMRPTHLGIVQDFVAAVREQRDPEVSGEQGMAVSALLDAAYQSARLRQLVRVA